MKLKAQTVFNKLEELAPLFLAESWDNSGLQIGSKDQVVHGILVTLDVDERAVELALEVGANLIISHHPLLFQGMKTIDYDTPKGSLIHRLINQGLTVYSAHTNLDSAPNGLNQYLADKLGLLKTVPLGEVKSQSLFKLVVFVPESHLEEVRQAMNDAGAGFIGNYRDCSFRTQGIGTFRPMTGSQPFLGSTGVLEEVNEFRLEVIVPEEVLNKVIRSMLQFHPYEEVAYDLIRLANRGQTYSFGRKGELPQEMTPEELAQNIKSLWGIDHVAISGFTRGKVKRIGLVSGSGASMIKVARAAGCEVLITGDVKYHEAREALDYGLILIDAGHDGMELSVVDMLTSYLEKSGRNERWEVAVHGFRPELIWRKI